MFTGLIQSVGTAQIENNSIIVKGCEPFSPLIIGDSIAVDGICLTVKEIIRGGFVADVSEETLMKTTIGIKGGIHRFVNLEPALRLSDRLGGHIVSGHIDCFGKILEIRKLKNSWDVEIGLQNSNYSKYLVYKGSIAVNGISLTVSSIKEDEVKFLIAVIPHTWTSTNLQYLSVGDLINLETDMMAKYAEKLLDKKNNPIEPFLQSEKVITKEWLEDEGWN